MRRIWSVIFSKPCAHDAALVVESVGVRREVCENCGHVSFAITPGVTDIDPVDLSEVSGL